MWSIGAQSGKNPTGTELEWTGAFVGQEMLHAMAKGNRMRGEAIITVNLGDPLAAMAVDQIDRATLQLGPMIMNVDSSSVAPPYPMVGIHTNGPDIA